MATIVTNEKDLGKALSNKQDEIIIEGDIVKKVFKIKAKGKVAWAIAFAAIVVAVAAVIATIGSGGAASPASVPAKLIGGTAAASVLGLSTAKSAVLIAVAAGSASSLNTLRKYKLIEKSNSKAILRKI